MKPATLDVVIAGRLYGFGRNKSYELARTGNLAPGVPVIKVGRNHRVVTSALERALGVDILDVLPPEALERAS